MYNHICLFIHIMQRKALGVFTNTLALGGAPILFLYRTAMRYLSEHNLVDVLLNIDIVYRG